MDFCTIAAAAIVFVLLWFALVNIYESLLCNYMTFIGLLSFLLVMQIAMQKNPAELTVDFYNCILNACQKKF